MKQVGHSWIGLGSGLGAAVDLRAGALRGVAARAVVFLGAALRTGVKWAVRSGVPPSRGRPVASQWR